MFPTCSQKVYLKKIRLDTKLLTSSWIFSIPTKKSTCSFFHFIQDASWSKSFLKQHTRPFSNDHNRGNGDDLYWRFSFQNWISFKTTDEQYLAFKAKVTCWSMAAVFDMMLWRREISLIHSKFSMCGWVAQLLIVKKIFLSTAAPYFQLTFYTPSLSSSGDI